MYTASVVKSTSSQKNTSSRPIPIKRVEHTFVPVQHYFNKLWSDIVNMPNYLNAWRSSGLMTKMGIIEPALDVSETNSAFRIHVELPGVDEKDVGVMIGDNHLTVKGVKSYETAEEGENFIRCESVRGSFERNVMLPENVNTDKASASFKSGILIVELPKKIESGKGVHKLEVHHAA